MKLAPVSADLLIKLGLGAVVVLGVLYAVNKAAAAAGSVMAGVEGVIHSVSPFNENNVLYQTANGAMDQVIDATGNRGKVIAGVSADGQWRLGTYAYDLLNRDPVTGKYLWWQF